MAKKNIANKDILIEYESIEKEFYDIGEEKKVAHIKLEYNKPSDIFDNNCISKCPIFCDDFISWVLFAFETIPNKYKIDLDIYFNDFDGFTEDTLKDAFGKNCLLLFKKYNKESNTKRNIAFSLIGFGVLSFTGMMIISKIWNSESTLHDIFFYFLDIVTTVLFWEAVGILFVERRENRQQILGFSERFDNIRFILKEKN